MEKSACCCDKNKLGSEWIVGFWGPYEWGTRMGFEVKYKIPLQA